MCSSDLQTEIETEVDSDFDALIPSNYIPSDILRLNLYQRITRARRDEALPALKEELRDRFGPVPEEVQNLLAMAKLRILAADIGIEKLRIRKGILTAYFSVSVFQEEKNKELLQKLIGKILNYSSQKIKFLKGNKFGLKFALEGTAEKQFQEAEDFLKNVRLFSRQ